MFNEVYGKLSEAVIEGVGAHPYQIRYNHPNAALLADLQVNVGVFVAFKNHNLVRDMARLLTDEEGNLRGWKAFQAEALKLDDKYNQRWLRTEYDHAITASRQATRWKEIERTARLYPNIEYITVGDDRVRQQHRQWHGMVLPITHPFWKSHYPPNDWGCRCTARRTKKPMDDKGVDTSSVANLKPGFNVNYGQAGEVFDRSHPYFDVAGFEAVARFAQNSLVNRQRKEIRDWMKASKTKGVATVKMKRIGEVEISNGAIRKMLSDKVDNAYQRNRLAYDLERVLAEAVYITSKDDSKGRFQNIKWYYFRVKGDDNWIIKVRKVRAGAGSESKLAFYTINDFLE